MSDMFTVDRALYRRAVALYMQGAAAAARRIAERTLFDPMREKHGLPPLSNKEARSILDAALDRLRKANKHKEGDHDAD